MYTTIEEFRINEGLFDFLKKTKKEEMKNKATYKKILSIGYVEISLKNFYQNPNFEDYIVVNTDKHKSYETRETFGIIYKYDDGHMIFKFNGILKTDESKKIKINSFEEVANYVNGLYNAQKAIELENERSYDETL